MNRWMVLLLSSLLAACAATPVAPLAQRDARFLHDRLFAAPTERIGADDLFALNDEMKRYIDVAIAEPARIKGRQRALIDALYSSGQLRLEYDTEMTRNAAQAFAARSGNCLSLVIMTAAFAKELGLTVAYQKVFVDDTWARTGDIYLSIGHVNVTLGRRKTDQVGVGYRVGVKPQESDSMTIDFLPSTDLRAVRTRDIGEEIIVAMYMNNRAVEALAARPGGRRVLVGARGRRADPGFLMPYNTLGAIYRRHGNPQEAEQVLSHVLEREPRNTQAMSNLIPVLNDLGRVEAAQRLAARLAGAGSRSAVQSFQSRDDRNARGRSENRERRVRPRSRARPGLPRVPFLAWHRLPEHRRNQAGTQAPDARDAEQHDPPRPRFVCGEARPDQRTALGARLGDGARRVPSSQRGTPLRVALIAVASACTAAA